MGKYNLDGHKLSYHYKEVDNFLSGKPIYPIYVEISPVGNCNHHCLFCHYNYLGHQGKFPEGRMISLVEELSQNEVKSVVFAGTGEPTLHKDTFKAIRRAKALGLDVAMSTNGAILKEEDLYDIAKNLTWIRFSFNAGSAEDYAVVHKTKEKDYYKVLDNIKRLVEIKEEIGSSITIGAQFVLIPQNKNNVVNHAKRLKDIGIDYFSVKHFYDHDENEFKVEKNFLSEDEYKNLEVESEKISDENFLFTVRDVDNLDTNRTYTKCFGLEFIAYIREDGELYTCFSYQHEKKTSLGNIFENSFSEVWESKQKRDAIDFINDDIDKNSCQPNCRHHQINKHLWELKHPSIEHVNFI